MAHDHEASTLKKHAKKSESSTIQLSDSPLPLPKSSFNSMLLASSGRSAHQPPQTRWSIDWFSELHRTFRNVGQERGLDKVV